MCMKTTKDLYKRFKEKVLSYKVKILTLYETVICDHQKERPDIIHINVRDLPRKETEVDILLDRFK